MDGIISHQREAIRIKAVVIMVPYGHNTCVLCKYGRKYILTLFLPYILLVSKSWDTYFCIEINLKYER